MDGDGIYKVLLLCRVKGFFYLANQDIVCRPCAEGRVFLNVHHFFADKAIKAHLGEGIPAAVKVPAIVMYDMGAIAQVISKVRSNAFTGSGL